MLNLAGMKLTVQVLFVSTVFLFFGYIACAEGVIGTAFQVFELNNRKGLKNEEGKVLIPAKYEDIGWSNGSVEPLQTTIGYKSNGFWGLTTVDDQPLTKAVYRDLAPMGNGQIKASRTDSFAYFLYFGVLDTKGNALIGFQYYDITPSGDNYIASRYENQQVLYGLISSREITLVPFQYKSVSYLGSGLYDATDIKEKKAIYTLAGIKLPSDGFDSLYRVNQALIIVSKEGKLGLIRNDGSFVLEPFYKAITPVNDSTFSLTSYPAWHLTDQKNKRLKTFHYDDIETVGPNIYRARTYEGDALINLSGEQLSNKSNWAITYTDDNFVVSKEQGKFRVYDKAGMPFLEQAFDSLHFDGKYFYTKVLKNGKPQWDIYNTFGRKVTRHSYQELKPEGSKMILARRDAYWGFLDFNGSLVIDHKFEKAHSFVSGMSAVEYVGKWGVIDLNGEWLIQPKFDYCEVVNESVILTRNQGATDLITPDSKWLSTSNHTIYKQQSWLVESTDYGTFGLLTELGERVVSPDFDEVWIPAADSVVFLKHGEFWWSLGKDGHFISKGDSKFQAVSPLSESFFGIVKDRKHGFVDLDNKLRIANRYDSAAQFSDGMVAIMLRGRWGFVDKAERLAVQPVYDSVEPFANGISVVSRNGKFGIINKNGEEVISLEFDEVELIDRGLFALRQADQYGFYHHKTDYLMLPRFNKLELLPNRLFVVEKRGQKGLINEKGVDLIPSEYSDIHYDLYNALYLCKEEGATETFVVR